MEPPETVEENFVELSEPRVVTATVLAVTPVPRPNSAPYKDHIMTLHLGNIDNRPEQAVVYTVSMRDNQWTEAAELRVGEQVKIRLSPWEMFDAQYGSWNRSEFEDDSLLLAEPYWGEILK